MAEDVQPITVRLPVELYERLRRKAFDLRVPMSALIIEGVEMRLAALQAHGNRNRAGRQTQGDERQSAATSGRTRGQPEGVMLDD